MKLTKRAIDAIEADGQERFLWDDEIPGFGLRVLPSGRKSYLIQYRMAGRTRRVVIGPHGVLTPETARREARKLLGRVAGGENVAEKKAEDRHAMTVGALCDLYLAEGLGTKKASTAYVDRGRIERHIKPLLGKKQAREIARIDVQRFMQAVADGKTAKNVKTGPHGRAIVRGGRGTATRTVGLLGAIFTFAVNHGVRPDNPVHGVKRFPDRKGERFLSAAEMARLGEALTAAEAEGENPLGIAAIRLLILTGARKSEILTARWEYVDQDSGYLRLPDSKTGAKLIPLSAPALEILSKLLRIAGNPYILPGLIKAADDQEQEPRHFVGLPDVWYRVRARAGLTDVRLHDLRHSFASVAVGSGHSLPIIGKLLGHKHAATTQRYAHLSDDPVRAAADKIANAISSAMNGTTGNVVELRHAK